MEAAVQVSLVRHAFGRAYDTDIFEDWRVEPSFKVRFETASQARTGRHGGWNYRCRTTATN
ncbi:hypothetical protein [Lactiplantibacillus fabifermentans]|uniref:Uncharacterized protein n=1 Tax=Lactiplantibacillus fabifermentans DSM 21115 TaxID=1413187 RepID=A0A0R2NF75_9LACO|nr:hypothetical protein [Lactiplantibacillus fabifermentans]KRO22275.1 hypothetical protein DY78_GL002112 [Lactiplantibacillus fabifermentans DSM 21115]